MSQKIEMVLRILVGILLVNSGLNKFFHYMTTPEMTENATSLMIAMGQSGYIFKTVALVEIIGGGLLIWGRMIPFALIILAPVIYNIFMIHAVMDPKGLPIGVVLVAVLGWVAWNRRDKFITLFE